jgi:molecular chaperone GrpE (heat shock protein)
MTMVTNKQRDSVVPARDERTEPADANQAALACLTTYAPSAVLFWGYVYRQVEILSQRVHTLEQQLDHLGANIERQQRRYSEHMAMLAACQRDTARVLNHEIDRHALHPAIETVVAMAEVLSHLKDCVSRRRNGGAGGGGTKKLRAEIDLSCTVAREKLAHLDVQIITAVKGQALDAKVHSACGSTVTTNRKLHGKISKLVTPGITYRGKVLRQARVTVFCTKTSKNQQK